MHKTRTHSHRAPAWHDKANPKGNTRIKENKNFIYEVKSTDLTAENADLMTDGEYYYAAIKGVLMSANCNVAKFGENKTVTLKTDKKIVAAEWLDNGKKIVLKTVNIWVPNV